MALDQGERYRLAAEDALQQLDWCIGYLHGIRKGKISRQLASKSQPHQAQSDEGTGRAAANRSHRRGMSAMRYACTGLGEQQAGTTVTVRLTGSVSNVILVDHANFARYRAAQPFHYEGGHYRQSPVNLEIPEDGHWYVVVDLGGYRGRVRADVEVESADGAPEADRHHTLRVT